MPGNNEVPTFDEWFEKKYGQSFEDMYMHPGASVAHTLLVLGRKMRDYISEVAKNAGE